MDSSVNVIATFLQQCTPHLLGDPWTFLENRQVKRMPDNSAALWSELSAQFTSDELFEAGFAVRSQPGDQLVPVGGWGDSRLVLSLRGLDERFRLIFDDVGTPGGPLPLLISSEDPWTTTQSHQLRFLLLARNILEVGLFRALALPAAPIAGIESASATQLEMLTKRLGWKQWETDPVRKRKERDDANAKACDWNTVTLVLVSWSPMAMELNPPAEIVSLTRFMRGLQDHLALNLAGVAVWTPTASELERLTFCCRLGHRSSCRAALLDSIRSSSRRLSAWQDGRVAASDPVAEYLAARQALDEVLSSRDCTPEVLALAEARLRKVLARELIDPLVNGAFGAFEPNERPLRLALAEIAQAVHLKAPYVFRDSARTNMREQLSLTATREFIELTTLLVNLSKMIAR